MRPCGHPDDQPGANTVCPVCELRADRIEELIEAKDHLTQAEFILLRPEYKDVLLSLKETKAKINKHIADLAKAEKD